MLLHEPAQDLAVGGVDHRAELHHFAIAGPLEYIAFVQHERDAAAHPGGEVPSGTTEHDDDATRHVFAAMVADAFDDRESAAVSHGESLACQAAEVRFP